MAESSPPKTTGKSVCGPDAWIDGSPGSPASEGVAHASEARATLLNELLLMQNAVEDTHTQADNLWGQVSMLQAKPANAPMSPPQQSSATSASVQTPRTPSAPLSELSSPKSPPTASTARSTLSADVFATRRTPALQMPISARGGQGVPDFLPPLDSSAKTNLLANARRDARQTVNTQVCAATAGVAGTGVPSSPSESRSGTHSSLPDHISFLSMSAGAGAAFGSENPSESRQPHQFSLDSMLAAGLQHRYPSQTSLPDRLGNNMAGLGSIISWPTHTSLPDRSTMNRAAASMAGYGSSSNTEAKVDTPSIGSLSVSTPSSRLPTQTLLPDFAIVNSMGTSVGASGTSPGVDTRADFRSGSPSTLRDVRTGPYSRWPTHTALPDRVIGVESRVDFQRASSHASLDAMLAATNLVQVADQVQPQPDAIGPAPPTWTTSAQSSEYVARRRSEPALLASARHRAGDSADRSLTNRGRRPSEATQTLAGDIFGCFGSGQALPANLDEQTRSGGLRAWQSPLDWNLGRQRCISPLSHEPRQQHPRHSQFRQASNAENLVHSPDTGAGFAPERSSNNQLSPPVVLGSRKPEDGQSARRVSDVSHVTISSGHNSVGDSIGTHTRTESSISLCTPSPNEAYFDVSESTPDEGSSTSRRASLGSVVTAQRSSASSTASQAQASFLLSQRVSDDCIMSRRTTDDAPKRNSSQTPRSSITIFELHRQVANALSEGDFEEVHTNSSLYVGLPCLELFFPVHQWGSSGEQFHTLKVYLQTMGISVVAPAYVPTFVDTCVARALHLASLIFILVWHLALWGGLLWTMLKFFTPGSDNMLVMPSFIKVVQALLLCVAVAAHALCVQLCVGRTLCVLLEIASRWSFIRCWERKVYRSALALFILDIVLSGSAIYAGKALINTDQQAGATYVAMIGVVATASWTLLLTLYLLLVMVVQFCSLGLDAFALDLLNAPGSSGLGGLVGQFNVLLAGIRRAAYAVQCGLAVFVGLTLVLAIAALCLIALPALPLGRMTAWGNVPGGACSGACDGTGDVIVVAWVTALLFLGLRLLNHIAVVNLKCKRLPALVHSLDFGQEIDHDRWCVAAHIAASEAGFPVHSVLITRGAVLKIGYISLAGLCLLITRLVVYHGDQDE